MDRTGRYTRLSLPLGDEVGRSGRGQAYIVWYVEVSFVALYGKRGSFVIDVKVGKHYLQAFFPRHGTSYEVRGLASH